VGFGPQGTFASKISPLAPRDPRTRSNRSAPVDWWTAAAAADGTFLSSSPLLPHTPQPKHSAGLGRWRLQAPPRRTDRGPLAPRAIREPTAWPQRCARGVSPPLAAKDPTSRTTAPRPNGHRKLTTTGAHPTPRLSRAGQRHRFLLQQPAGAAIVINSALPSASGRGEGRGQDASTLVRVRLLRLPRTPKRMIVSVAPNSTSILATITTIPYRAALAWPLQRP
jgi:hypothetical protein